MAQREVIDVVVEQLVVIVLAAVRRGEAPTVCPRWLAEAVTAEFSEEGYTVALSLPG